MDEELSKSQKKRDAEALQRLGVELSQLKLEQLAKCNLPANLYEAILVAREMKSHGAKRRQIQLIGKLMRTADSAAIAETYQSIKNEAGAKTTAFHEVEAWRHRLLTEGNEALTDLVNSYPELEIQTLRQLIKKTLAEQARQQDKGSAKMLFRCLRAIIT